MSAGSGSARFLKNVLWLAAGNGARLAAGLLSTAVVARYLGVEQFGMLSFATVFVTMFAAITGAGLERLLLRELVARPEHHGRILGSAVLVRTLGGTTTVAVVLLVLPWVVHAPGSAELIYVVLAGMFLSAPGIVGAFFSSRLESRYLVTISTVTLWATALAKIGLSMSGAAILSFVIVDAVGAVLAAGAVYALLRLRSAVRLSWDLETARQLAQRASPFVLIGALYAVQLRIDQVMLNTMLGARAVGLYAVAIKPYELLLFIPGIIATTAVPSLVVGRQLGSETLEQRVRLMYGGLALCAWPLVLMVFALAPLLVGLLYGPAFVEAADLVRIHIWALLLAFLDTGRAQWSLAEGQQHVQAMLMGGAVLLKVGLNWIMIPEFGVAGAATAAVLTIIGYSIVGPLLINGGQRRQVRLMLRALLLLDARATALQLWRLRKR